MRQGRLARICRLAAAGARRGISAAPRQHCRKLKEFQIHKVTVAYTSLPQPRRELPSNRAYGAQLSPSRRSSCRTGRLRGGPELSAAAGRNARRVAFAADRSSARRRTRPHSRTGGRRSTTRSSTNSSSRRSRVTRRRNRRMRAWSRPEPGAASRRPDFWPTLDASAGGNRTNSEARVSDPDVGLSGGSDEIYNAGLDSGWELDLFGGQRRAFEASNAQLGASQADLRDVLVTLLGDVALSYVDVRTAQSRLTYAEKNLEAQRGVLDITTLARSRRPGDCARGRAGAEQLPADTRGHPVAAIESRASDEPTCGADRRPARIARSNARGAQADSGRAAGDRGRRAGRRLASSPRHSQCRAPARRADRASRRRDRGALSKPLVERLDHAAGADGERRAQTASAPIGSACR